MPKKSIEVAEAIQALMQKKRVQVLTMPWAAVYKLAGLERLRDERWNRIYEACLSIGIVAGYGGNVATFCQDANFSS